MELVDGFTYAWIAFIAFFGIAEGRALARKDKGDTLSEHVWKWMDVKDDAGNVRKTYTVKRIGLIGGLAWLLAHLGFGFNF